MLEVPDIEFCPQHYDMFKHKPHVWEFTFDSFLGFYTDDTNYLFRCAYCHMTRRLGELKITDELFTRAPYKDPKPVLQIMPNGDLTVWCS